MMPRVSSALPLLARACDRTDADTYLYAWTWAEFVVINLKDETKLFETKFKQGEEEHEYHVNITPEKDGNQCAQVELTVSITNDRTGKGNGGQRTERVCQPGGQVIHLP